MDRRTSRLVMYIGLAVIVVAIAIAFFVSRH
jgi:preprotein translocase subunit Sec61beta